MRWVVYGLLVLNLGLLTWNLQSRDATGAVNATTKSAGEPDQNPDTALPLLEELSIDSLRQRTIAAGEGPANSPQVAAARSAASASDADSKGTGRTAVKANPGRAKIAGEVAQVGPALKPPASVSAARACLTLGPLSSKTPIEQLREWLQLAGATVDVRADERREVTLHWVYFPPLETRKAALAEVERLLGEGITDVVVVPKGDMANAVSLGVFSRAQSRDRRLKEMKKRGYKPLVVPRYGVKLATWVDVSGPSKALSDEQLRARWPRLAVHRKPCKGPAA